MRKPYGSDTLRLIKNKMVESVLNGGDLHTLIFTHLSTREWGLVCAPVCKVWRKVAYCKTLWSMVWKRIIAQVPALNAIEIDGYACGYRGREWFRVICDRLRRINRVDGFTSLMMIQLADMHIHKGTYNDFVGSSVHTWAPNACEICWSTATDVRIRYRVSKDKHMRAFSLPIRNIILDGHYVVKDCILGPPLAFG